MKIRVHMKTPDAITCAIKEAYPTRVFDFDADDFKNLTQEDDEYWEVMSKRAEAEILFEKWFKHGESVTLELDTESETCKVVGD